MPNRWTRVPAGAPPTLPRWASTVLPLADAFMLAMVSRPSTGSLRNTWVTPATLLLSGAATMGALAVIVGCTVALIGGGGWVPVVGMALCAAIAAGSTAVGLVGLAQRHGG